MPIKRGRVRRRAPRTATEVFTEQSNRACASQRAIRVVVNGTMFQDNTYAAVLAASLYRAINSPSNNTDLRDVLAKMGTVDLIRLGKALHGEQYRRLVAANGHAEDAVVYLQGPR